jgi:Tfp pilus assembly protein PilO
MAITIAILATIHALAFYVVQPQLIAQQSSTTIQMFQSQIDKRGHEIHQAVNEYKNDSDTATLNKIAALRSRIKQSNADLESIADSFVDPKQMTTLIQSLLNESHLHVERFENTPAEVITSKSKTSIDMYKHGIYIEVTGSYHDQIRFLRKLETSPWKIFWKEAQIQADAKGITTLSLSIYTLNYNIEWLEI